MSHVPANLVTGFLGAGKTTAIIHLLRYRPEGERWAVLVNEFGELGIDGATLAGASGVAVREVAGGCICCTGNVPMRVALTQLLRAARPHRLLIEPTGLGHAAAVYDTLTGADLSSAIALASVICIVDPRQAADPRIAAGDAFRDQLSLADVVVINKRDAAMPAELESARVAANGLYPPRIVVETERGAIDASLLASPHVADGRHAVEHAVGEQSWSVRFPRGAVFDRQRTGEFFERLNSARGTEVPGLLRAKGIFRVGRDALLADWAAGRAETREVAYRRDSRATFIVAAGSAPDWGALEATLRRALLR
jgi:G3E family GTPase